MFKTITFFKFIYLYLAYWLVGLAEEDFYISKGNYFADLGKYYSAIKSYKKALQEDELYSLYASIGWCYAEMEHNALALENYRKAYERVDRQEIAIPLAYLELESGNPEKSKDILNNVKISRDKLDKESLNFLNELEQKLVNL